MHAFSVSPPLSVPLPQLTPSLLLLPLPLQLLLLLTWRGQCWLSEAHGLQFLLWRRTQQHQGHPCRPGSDGLFQLPGCFQAGLQRLPRVGPFLPSAGGDSSTHISRSRLHGHGQEQLLPLFFFPGRIQTPLQSVELQVSFVKSRWLVLYNLHFCGVRCF